MLAGQLLHIEDDISRRRFLIDTGATYSVFPYCSAEAPSGPLLSGPGGRPIACWGEKTFSNSFSGQPFRWTFLLADVRFPIVGADFLKHFHLVVDLAAWCVIDTTTLRRFGPGISSSPSSGGLLSLVEATPAAYRSLFSEFEDVAGVSGVLPPTKHGVEHVLETSGRPVSARFRRLDAEKLRAAREEFLKMEKDGIIRRSSSCWASPLHMVRKPDGSWRPCGDYRRLNLVTALDKYPVPNIQDLSSRLHGCRVFCKLDLRKGYYPCGLKTSSRRLL